MAKFRRALLFSSLIVGLASAGSGHGQEDGAARASGVIAAGDLLTLDRCLELARQRQPSIAAGQANIAANRSRIQQARANYLPQINVTGAYNRFTMLPGAAASVNPHTDFGNDQFATSAGLNQNLYDFGRTGDQVKVQELRHGGAKADLDDVVEQTMLQVKLAYYSVLQAKRSKAVDEEAVEKFKQHLTQAQGFFEVGAKPRFDVTKAEVDLSNAQLQLIKSSNAHRLAKVNLNAAMGLPTAPEYELEDNLSYEKFEISLSEALDQAYEQRADLRSLLHKRQAAEAALALARKGDLPSVNGNAAYSWAGSHIPLEHGWNLGVAVNIPIFNGHLTEHQAGEAQANLSAVQANEELLRQRIFAELQQAHLNLEEAGNTIPTAELAVQQAYDNLAIANGRYAAGVGGPIEVTDAQLLYSSAQAGYIQALHAYKRAQASLGKAMGQR